MLKKYIFFLDEKKKLIHEFMEKILFNKISLKKIFIDTIMSNKRKYIKSDSNTSNTIDLEDDLSDELDGQSEKNRQLDTGWLLAPKILNKNGKKVSICKLCDSVISPKIERIRNHFNCLNSNCCILLRPKANNIMDYMPRALTKDELDNFKKELGLFYYSSGLSFNTVENPHLNKALQILRPDAQVPHRKLLSGNILDFHYGVIQTNIKKCYESSNICITSDTTTNQRGIPITNFMCVVDGKAYYHTSKEGGQVSHTGDIIVDEIVFAMNEIGVDKFVGLCTDNASNNV